MQLGMVGGAELDQSRYREIESIFGEPDEGLSNSFKDLFGAVDALRTDPSDRALRGGLVQAGNAIGQGFRLVSERLGELGGSSFDEIRGLVRQVNERAAAVADLNAQIIAAEANGSDANDLRDIRGQHIKEIGKQLDVRAIERSSGSVDLLVGGNLLVARRSRLDARHRQGHRRLDRDQHRSQWCTRADQGRSHRRPAASGTGRRARLPEPHRRTGAQHDPRVEPDPHHRHAGVGTVSVH